MAIAYLNQSPIQNILSRLENVKRSGNGWIALCPTHDDSVQSLSINLGDDGRILLYCHAGCRTEDIIISLGLTMKDLFQEQKIDKKNKPSNSKKRSIVQTYNYTDLDGNLIFQVCRTEPKGFFQRRPDGSGGWINGLGNIKPVLYRLKEVIQGIQANRTIFITEGEKDADNLKPFDLIATTAPMGAGKWNSHYSSTLKDAKVVILPDNDAAGIKHAQAIAKNIYGKAKIIKILELPGLPVKGDVSDWIAAGGTRQKLIDIVEETEQWEPEQLDQLDTEEAADVVNGNPLRLSDLGNATRLVEKEGKDLRYDYTACKWLVWSGKHWELDDTGEVLRRMKSVVKGIYEEAREALKRNDETAFSKLNEFAKRSENHGKITAAVKVAESELPVRHSDLDKDLWMLNCMNGTLMLRGTCELREHRREDYITQLCPVDFEGLEVSSEIWERFLETILPDKELRDFVQRAVGYSLTGSTQEEVLFFCHGPGGSGKSTFLSAIASILGNYGITLDFESLIENGKSSGGPRNDIAMLAGKRFVQSIEVSEGRKLAEALVKTVTGGDMITARFLYGEYFQFLPQFKLWMAANSKPIVRSDDSGLWRRILLIPFNQAIPLDKRDPAIKEILRDPSKCGAAILAWAVKGCLEWQKNGLKIPNIVMAATNNYRDEMDIVGQFLEDACLVDRSLTVKVNDLRKAYEDWCESLGLRPFSGQRFKSELENRGFIQSRTMTFRYWSGLGLMDKNRSPGSLDYLSGYQRESIYYEDNEPY